MRRPVDWRVHAALLFVQATFGAFHVFGKYVLAYLDPASVASLRALGATPLLFLLGIRAQPRVPRRGDLWRLALLGFLGVFGNQLLFIVGLRHSTATNAGILMLTIPVFVALVAGALGVERVGWRRWQGILLSMAGALVMLGGAGLSLEREHLLGNGLLVLNCVCYALYLVLLRPVLQRVHPVAAVGWAFLFGGTGVVVAGLPQLLNAPLASLPTSAWVSLGYIVLVPTVVNYALSGWAVGRSSPALVAAYTTLQPVAATSLAVAFLGEEAGVKELVGFLLIVTGLVRVATSPEVPAAEPASGREKGPP